jgi:hypothetical protein
MPFPLIAAAIIGSSVVGGAMSARAQSRAAKSAAAAQTAATDAATQAQLEGSRMALEEQRRQFDAIQQLFRPYVEAGGGALSRQMALLGVSGPEAQASAIREIEMGPEFAALTRQGEEAILQQASATGGLRGGNVQQALAKFRPEVLSSLISQQYTRLGGLTQVGQASAANQAAQGQAFGTNISNIYSQQGQALANQAMGRGNIAAQLALARGQASANMWGNIAGSVGLAAGLGAFGVTGGRGAAPSAMNYMGPMMGPGITPPGLPADIGIPRLPVRV